MKVIKKLCVYLLVGMIIISSVTLSYRKAHSCEAISIGIGIGLGVITLGLVLYGAYYVSNSDSQDGVKQSLSDYANTTAEGAKRQYEFNKKLFNDFCTYATSKAGSNAAVRGADGKKYTVKDMQKEGFPSFEKWDDEMKKQSKKPVKNFGSIWDKMSFGLDLLEFIRGFYDDQGNTSGGSAEGQSYFEGEEAYYNKETGEFSIFADTLYYNSNRCSFVDNVFTIPPDAIIKVHYSLSGTVKESYRDKFRPLFCIKYLTGNKIPFDGYVLPDDKGKIEYGMQSAGYSFGLSLSSPAFDDISYDCYSVSDGVETKFTNPANAVYSCQLEHFLSYDYETKQYKVQPTNYLFLSSNAPFFFDSESARVYSETGDYSGAINLPPSKPTVAPTGSASEKPVTPVSIYINNFQNKNVTVNDITNFNYYIVNNWDTTTNQTQNLTTVINNYYYGTLGNAEGVADTPVPTATPVPTLTNVDGDNTTNNYIINITNILQPIQETVTNIYNFFQIDTQEISYQMNFDSPAYKFDSVNESINSLKSAIGDDSYDENTGLLKADYPQISMKCPKILAPVVDTVGEDGEKEIVIVDFKDYALWFVRLRKFLEAILWIGMLFWLMKEIKVIFTV